MSLDPRHLACVGVSVINIFSLWIDDSRRGSHGYTVVVPCQWCITRCMLSVSSESVDWNDRKSQEGDAAVRNHVPLGSEGSSCCRHYFHRTWRVSKVSGDFCIKGYCTQHPHLSGKRASWWQMCTKCDRLLNHIVLRPLKVSQMGYCNV